MVTLVFVCTLRFILLNLIPLTLFQPLQLPDVILLNSSGLLEFTVPLCVICTFHQYNPTSFLGTPMKWKPCTNLWRIPLGQLPFCKSLCSFPLNRFWILFGLILCYHCTSLSSWPKHSSESYRTDPLGMYHFSIYEVPECSSMSKIPYL